MPITQDRVIALLRDFALIRKEWESQSVDIGIAHANAQTTAEFKERLNYILIRYTLPRSEAFAKEMEWFRRNAKRNLTNRARQSVKRARLRAPETADDEFNALEILGIDGSGVLLPQINLEEDPFTAEERQAFERGKKEYQEALLNPIQPGMSKTEVLAHLGKKS